MKITPNLIIEEVKRHSVLVILPLTIMVLAVVTLISVQFALGTNTQLTKTSQEVADLDKKVGALTNNSIVSQTDVQTYNQILNQLIPDKEDYFSIIVALETLSRQTGFIISRYTVNVGNSTQQKLSLTVEGDGDATSFLRFLQDYQFAGGRLITNENLEFSPTTVGRIKLALNFYSQKVDTANQSFAQIDTQDVTLLQSIKDKISVNFVPSIASGSASYATKANPF